jgi:hypothetical protein
MLIVQSGVVAGDSIVRPRESGAEDNWDTVGRATERSQSPAPTVEEIMLE